MSQIVSFTQKITAPRRLLRLALGATFALSAACAGDGPTNPAGNTPPPTVPTPPPPAPNPTGTGALVFAVSGLDAGVSADIAVTGPAAYARTVTAAGSLTGLTAGQYVIVARPVSANGVSYTPVQAIQEVTVGADLPVAVSVTYRSQSGVLVVSVFGLPSGANAAATLTAPAGSTQTISATTTVSPAQVGRWRLTSDTVQFGGAAWAPEPRNAEADVAAGDTARLATSYAIVTGSIAVAVTGLPTGVTGNVNVTGPRGYARAVSATTTLGNLEPGSYTVTAAPVSANGINYQPSPTSHTVTVTASLVAAAAPVDYWAQAGRVAVTVDGLPPSVTPDLELDGPSGTRTLRVTPDGTIVADSVPVGTYTLVVNPIVSGGMIYTGDPATSSVTIAAGGVVSRAVKYKQGNAPGSLNLTISGLPGGTPGDVLVTGPQSYSRTLTVSALITGLAPGTYTIVSRTVRNSFGAYLGTPVSASVTVSSNATTPATVTYAPAPVTVEIPVSGLPAPNSASITVTQPSGSTQLITTSSTYNNASAGRWRLSAASIVSGGSTYTPTPASYDQNALYGDTLRFPVSYGVSSGSIAVAITGLPNGVSGSALVTGPNGYSQAVTGTVTLVNLTAGSYTVTAANVTSAGTTYVPTPVSRVLNVVASQVAAAAPIAYAAQLGSLSISTTGLPGGVTPTFTLTGANGTRALSGTATVDSLPAGSYTLSASSMTSGGSTYSPTPASRSITITAGSTTGTSFSYAATTNPGSLAITVSGLGTGVAGDLLVTGPSSYSQAVTATTTLAGITPGQYTITVRNVRTAQGTMAASPSVRVVDVPAGGSASNTATYALLPAVVEAPVSGLPGGTSASISITSPSGSVSAATGSTTINPAATGRWRLSASSVISGGNTYAPTPTSYDQTVLGGDTLRFPVTYALASGSIAIAVTGLPSGTSGSVTVTGPGGYSQAVTGTVTLTNLTPGSYTVNASSVTAGGLSYTPSPTTRAVTVSASLVAAAAPVAYAAQIGRLTISTSGLPGGTPTFTLTGTNGTRNISGAGTTDSIAPGSYTLTAANVVTGGNTYTPSPSSSAITITAGATTGTTITYSGGGGGGPTVPNLVVENAYVTQAVQNWAGTAKIVVGRDALVRVFVTAASSNTLTPTVRVRVYDGATLLQTYTVNAASSSVVTSVSEGTMSASWNVVVPGANVRANMKILADVDPNATLSETDRTDNIWPRNGTPQTVATTTSPTLNIKFIPVTLGGLTGNISDANKEQFLVTTRLIHPVKDIVTSIRAPYTSNVSQLQSNDANAGWTTLLSEINALRGADGAPGTQHYYGVVKVSYGSGYAGYGYIPGRAAVGWDYLPTGDAIAAHELGHNFSRPHTPCGVSGDANYPYAGGATGQWGWNATSNALMSPSSTDIMGYCGNQWISDWTWGKEIDWRSYAGGEATASGAVGDALLVWGRVTDGQVTLEPAFRLNARPTPRAQAPTHRVVLSDADGNALLDLPIETEKVDHEFGHDERQFAVVVPWSEALEGAVANLSVRDLRQPLRGAMASSASVLAMKRTGNRTLRVPLPATSDTLQRVAGGKARVTWDNRSYRMAMVRDAATGEILSFLRKPGDGFADRGRAVDIVYSDGVRSTTRRNLRLY